MPAAEMARRVSVRERAGGRAGEGSACVNRTAGREARGEARREEREGGERENAPSSRYFETPIESLRPLRRRDLRTRSRASAGLAVVRRRRCRRCRASASCGKGGGRGGEGRTHTGQRPARAGAGRSTCRSGLPGRSPSGQTFVCRRPGLGSRLAKRAGEGGRRGGESVGDGLVDARDES